MQPYKYLNTININAAVLKFDKHPDTFKTNFEFTEVSQDEVKKKKFYI